MLIATWQEWLDQHIPYYELAKQSGRFGDNPPEAVLIISPVDRNRKINQRPGSEWSTWEGLDNEITDMGFQVRPMFLESDTYQRWYWAFWSHSEALMAVMKLS